MILVLAEHRDGVLNRATWEAVAAAQSLGGSVRVAVLGQDVSAIAGELAAAAVEAVLTVEEPALAVYTADGYTQAIAGLIAAESPTLVFAAHTYQARDVMPRAAA